MQFAPIANVEEPMSTEMLRALTLLEARYVMKDVVSLDEVHSLLDEHGLRDEFQPRYLLPSLKHVPNNLLGDDA